jgi:hypothetical protein
MVVKENVFHCISIVFIMSNFHYLLILKREIPQFSCYVGEGQIYKQSFVLKMMIFVTKYLIVQRHNLPYDWKQTRRLPIFVMLVFMRYII